MLTAINGVAGSGAGSIVPRERIGVAMGVTAGAKRRHSVTPA